MNKRDARLRRAKRTRMQIKRIEADCLCVFKTARNMYAQITTAKGSLTVVSASTLDKDLKSTLKNTGNIDAAKEVGKLIAQRALKAGITKVAFDRSGFLYHGRVKALADAARENGLEF
jgi:large subunit ribosomal protein L18